MLRALGMFSPVTWRALMTAVIALMVAGGEAQSETISIGDGHVKIALVLSMSANDAIGAAARSVRHGAEMALAEWVGSDLQLLVEDDVSTSGDLERAIRHVLDEGAELIVCPMMHPDSIRTARKVAGQGGVPIIVFSDDRTVAASGIYLLSDFQKPEVEWIVDFTIARGRRVLAALLPDSPYGRTVEAAFRDTITRRGGTLAGVEHYPAGAEPTRETAARLAIDSIEAILLADGADGVARVARSLTSAGVARDRIQLIGTGAWYDPRTFAEPTLQGGWFASPNLNGYYVFADRYRQRFSEDANVSAVLAYDIISLASVLDKTYGSRRFSAEVLTDPSGFKGVVGQFRFRGDGTTERGLWVYRVTPSGADLLAQPPERFQPE